jgi:hypothetical protein
LFCEVMKISLYVSRMCDHNVSTTLCRGLINANIRFVNVPAVLVNFLLTFETTIARYRPKRLRWNALRLVTRSQAQVQLLKYCKKAIPMGSAKFAMVGLAVRKRAN